jgi:hypothetical protein
MAWRTLGLALVAVLGYAVNIGPFTLYDRYSNTDFNVSGTYWGDIPVTYNFKPYNEIKWIQQFDQSVDYSLGIFQGYENNSVSYTYHNYSGGSTDNGCDGNPRSLQLSFVCAGATTFFVNNVDDNVPCAMTGTYSSPNNCGFSYALGEEARSPSMTPSASTTPSESVSPSESQSLSVSASNAPSVSESHSDTPSPTQSRSDTPSPTNSRSIAPSPTVSRSVSQTPTVTPISVCQRARMMTTGLIENVQGDALYFVRHWSNITHPYGAIELIIGQNPTCTETSTTCSCHYITGPRTGCASGSQGFITYTYGTQTRTTFVQQNPMCTYYYATTLDLSSPTPSPSLSLSLSPSPTPSASALSPSVSPSVSRSISVSRSVSPWRQPTILVNAGLHFANTQGHRGLYYKYYDANDTLVDFDFYTNEWSLPGSFCRITSSILHPNAPTGCGGTTYGFCKPMIQWINTNYTSYTDFIILFTAQQTFVDTTTRDGVIVNFYINDQLVENKTSPFTITNNYNSTLVNSVTLSIDPQQYCDNDGTTYGFLVAAVAPTPSVSTSISPSVSASVSPSMSQSSTVSESSSVSQSESPSLSQSNTVTPSPAPNRIVAAGAPAVLDTGGIMSTTAIILSASVGTGALIVAVGSAAAQLTASAGSAVANASQSITSERPNQQRQQKKEEEEERKHKCMCGTCPPPKIPKLKVSSAFGNDSEEETEEEEDNSAMPILTSEQLLAMETPIRSKSSKSGSAALASAALPHIYKQLNITPSHKCVCKICGEPIEKLPKLKRNGGNSASSESATPVKILVTFDEYRYVVSRFRGSLKRV